MQMTPEEIRRNYRESKNKKKQIGILAELNDCNRKMIEEIIGTDAEPVGICKTETPAPAELSKGEIIELLFRQIDELDSEIKRLEEEYRKVTTAIEVLGRI